MSDKNVKSEKKELYHPMDGLIEVAKCLDTDQVLALHVLIVRAVKARQWDIDNMPAKWIHVRAEKLVELSHWMFLRDKLFDYWQTIDGIPF